MPVAADLPPFLISPPAYIRKEKSGLLDPDTHVVPAMLPGMVPVFSRAAGIPPRTLTYLEDNYVQTSNTSHTWGSSQTGNAPLGPESANRRVIVAACGVSTSNRTMTAATANGISLTKIVAAENNLRPIALFMGVVPTGSALTSVSVIISGSPSRLAWAAWVTSDLTTTTPVATHTKQASAASPHTHNVVTQPGDNVIPRPSGSDHSVRSCASDTVQNNCPNRTIARCSSKKPLCVS